MILICKRYSKSHVTRPRGLCWTCYYTPGVKEIFPVDPKHARRRLGNFNGYPKLSDIPTTATPGTPEKLVVMEVRAKAGLAIFHPRDARFEGDPRALEGIRAVAVARSPPAFAEDVPPGGRRCPRLQHHLTGQAAVSFKVNGRRRWVYFGLWNSPEATASYAAFKARWPAQLEEVPTVKPHVPRLLTFNDEVKRLAERARSTGLKPVTIRYRLGVLHWPVERALTTPAKPTRCAG